MLKIQQGYSQKYTTITITNLDFVVDGFFLEIS